MDSGFYAACAGLAARTQALDLAANNLANTSTRGYKAQMPVFQSTLAQAGGDDLEQAVNNFGVLAGTRLDDRAGALETTGNDFDLALEGNAYFVVKTAAGAMYTRNGNFELSSNGQLVTAQGDAVMGEQGPIQLPAGKVAVASDGNISVNGALAGKLQVVQFIAGAPLQSVGAGYYTTAANKVKAADKYTLKQGVLEGSNVNPMTGAVELIEIQRQFATLQRVFSAFDSDMNKTAAQDLPRV
jgi:flagellar basal-body rod protein FlgF/flagellar basal-body rod protein FlgG